MFSVCKELEISGTQSPLCASRCGCSCSTFLMDVQLPCCKCRSCVMPYVPK